ncbi:MAG: DUF542 domain-containing protein [Alphaproteobacteria bacterium]|nr:DUF542 domain-containing protein [Alphaproteobacteria bacterium]
MDTALAAPPATGMPAAVAVPGSRRLGEVVATVPGATAVLRAYGIDFCCRGDVSIGQAAAEHGLSVAFVEARLRELGREIPEPAADAEPAVQIGYILSRFHEAHRRELPELIELAKHVENVQHGHPALPTGLTTVLQRIAAELEFHMRKEEQMLFPMMAAGGHPYIRNPISCMRHDHDHHRDSMIALEGLIQGGIVLDDACVSWRALAIGLRKLIDDLMAHIRYENEVLFARFEADHTGAIAAA